MGGVSFPLLSDFHPKGKVAESFGLYLAEAGITDRATVLIDAGGTIRHISSVGPGGKRDMNEFLAMAKKLDAEYEGKTKDVTKPAGLPDGSVLFVKSNCIFSRWAQAARNNLHLDTLALKNVSEDADAKAELEKLGGSHQAPALLVDGKVQYESGAIVQALGERCGIA